MFGRFRYLYCLAALLTAGLWTACETDLEVPFKTVPRLTITAHLSPNSWEQQRVFVYTTLSPADSSSFITPSGLMVAITDMETGDRHELDSFRQGPRVFFPIPPGFLAAGHTYSITASAPGFAEVHAMTAIPEPSTISDLAIREPTLTPSGKNDNKNILRYTLGFQIDHLEANRYYHLVFFNEYKGLENQLFLVSPQPSDDQVFLQHYAYGVLFDRYDQRVEGPLSFEFVDWVLENQELKRVFVELRTISEEYYRYHSTLTRQLIIRQDPFAEPVPIFNNIQGGYGNFSGFSPNIYSSGLPE